MSTNKGLRLLRVGLLLGIWVMLAALVVFPADAQGDGGVDANGSLTGAAAEPEDLNDVAVRLAPLLVGAALIERTLELIFNWVERALLDVTHTLHGLAARISGTVLVDLHKAWDEFERASNALIHREALAAAAAEASLEADEDWPLEELERQVARARDALLEAQKMVKSMLSSPVYVARKRLAASMLSLAFGLGLAVVGNLRVFQPLGVDVASWFEEPFDVLDLVLAGVLMGLGTEWVHQVIGLIIQGKGLLGRAATGEQLDIERVRALAHAAVEEVFTEQVAAVTGGVGVRSPDRTAQRRTGSRVTDVTGDESSGGGGTDRAAWNDLMTGEPSEAPSDARVDDAAPERLTAEDMFARRRAALNQAMQAEMVGGVVDAVVDETVDQVVDDSLDNPPDDAEDDPDIWSREALARELQRGPYEETPTYPLPTMTPEAEELLARGLSPASSDVPDADAPADMVGLADETVARVHEDGADVYQGPDRSEPVIGSLEGGEFVPVTGLVWRQDTWLQTPWWEQPQAWLVGEETDFARSTAYSQVVEAWYASEAVMRFRRDLVRDIMRVRSADQDRIAAIETLDSDTLSEMEENLAEQTMLSGYHGLWRLARHLGLPDRFRQLPVQPQPPETFLELEINGFGPCRYAFENWPVFYGDTRGLHSGVDFLAPAGTPLIAVADGRIVDFVPLGDPNDRSLALRPYLPEHFRTGTGGRVLSNVIVVYQHLNGDPENALVQVGDDVQAGQIIGTSGWPVHTWEDGTRSIQYNNAHVHIAVHLVTDGTGALGHTMPFNPLLFWSPRMVAWQARLATHSSDRPYPHSGQPFGRLGFFSVGAFRVGDDLPDFWTYEPSVVAPWPPDVYPLDELLETMQAWPAYPQDGITAI